MKNDFIRNVSLLVGGTVIAQIISIAASPILSRLYTPNDFGLFATFMAIIGIGSALSTLKYEMAIVIEQDDFLAKSIQVLSVFLLLATTVFFIIGIFATNHFGSTNFDLPLITLLYFFSSYYLLQTNILNREKKYKLISGAGVVHKTSTVVLQIGFGIWGLELMGLIYGTFFGVFLAFVYILYHSIQDFFFPFKEYFSKLKEVAKKHYRFPVYSAPQTLLNTFSNQIPIYLLGFFYGLEVVGAYWMAMRIIQLPSLLVGRSVQQVYFEKASNLIQDNHALLGLFQKTTFSLFKVSIIPVLIIFLFSKVLFIYILGVEWETAGEYAKWMMLWTGVGFISPPAIMTLVILNKQKTHLLYDFLMALFRTLALVIGGLFLISENTIILFSVIGFLFNVSVIYYVRYILGRKPRIHKNQSI